MTPSQMLILLSGAGRVRVAEPQAWPKARAASRLLYLQTLSVTILAYLLVGESLHDYDVIGAAFIVAGRLAGHRHQAEGGSSQGVKGASKQLA